MTAVRVMAVFQATTGVPEDRFVNTFHFSESTNTDPGEGWGDQVAGFVELFYTALGGGSTSVGNLLNSFVERDAQTIWYDLSESQPRTPHPHDFTLAAATAGRLPEEVAVVLSLRGNPPVTPRRRGRLYIGPLVPTANVLTHTTTGPSRVASSAPEHIAPLLLERAESLVGACAAIGRFWSIRSSVPEENFVPIASAYVDNAFDIQRRRGADPDARLEWPAV